MTSSPTRQSKRYRRTRRDHASETAEDYVEAISDIQCARGECRGADLAKLFGVSAVTVSKTLARLQKEGLVETQRYGPVGLTRRGKILAATARKRHAIVLEFLLALGVPRSQAEVDSEGIEHHVSDATLREFRRFVEQRPVC